MAVLGDKSAAVAAKDDLIASEPVAAESAVSRSEDRAIRLEGTRLGDMVNICSIPTDDSELIQLVPSILPNDTAEGKAAGASSAVAEMAPPASLDSPEPSAARPAPGSAANAPPPIDPWPAREAMIPPQNCKRPPTYVELIQLQCRMLDPLDPERDQLPSYTNVIMNWWRDGAQGYDPRKWANPPVQKLDFSFTDKHRIGSIIRVSRGGDYDWCRNTPHDNKYVIGVDVSIHKMLAHSKVINEMLKDENGQTYDVMSLHLECLEPGTSNDYDRQLNLILAGKYPLEGKMLPKWEWVLVRKTDRKRFRFCVDCDGKTWSILPWPWAERIDWGPSAQPYSQRSEMIWVSSLIAKGHCQSQLALAYRNQDEGEKGGTEKGEKGGKGTPRGSGGNDPGGDTGHGRGNGSNGGNHAPGSGSGYGPEAPQPEAPPPQPQRPHPGAGPPPQHQRPPPGAGPPAVDPTAMPKPPPPTWNASNRNKIPPKAAQTVPPQPTQIPATIPKTPPRPPNQSQPPAVADQAADNDNWTGWWDANEGWKRGWDPNGDWTGGWDPNGDWTGSWKAYRSWKY